MTQILILFVALIGVIWRVYSRRMTACEWWIIGFVAMSLFLVQLQMFVGENGKLQWILRYHQAALTLLYGWAGWTAAELIRRTSGWRLRAVVSIVGIWLLSTGGTSLWRIVKHGFTESSRYARNEAAKWAAEFIARDWKGPRVDAERFFTVQEYHPRLRPVIRSIGARLPWLAKGRWYSKSPDVHRNEKPDYALLPASKKQPEGMEVIAEKSFGKKKRTYVLYRIQPDFWYNKGYNKEKESK